MRYRIELAAPLSPELLTVFAGFMATDQPAGHGRAEPIAAGTVLVGEITDQSDLHGILRRIENLGLRLVSINPAPAR